MNKRDFLALAIISLTTRNASAHLFSRDFFKEIDTFDQLMNTKLNNINMYKNTKTNKFTIEVTLPGFDKKDIKVKIDHNTSLLTILAENKIEEKDEKTNEKNVYIYKSQSIRTNYFNRSFTLPDYVDYSKSDKIETTCENGILKIEFPMLKETDEKEKINETILEIK